MGYSSALNGCYPTAQGSLRSSPFTFRKRLERVDWRKIASLDIDRISRDLDFEALQDNIGNVAFCNIECEIDPRCCDPNYIKLFRLGQLIIEYLLHSQDYLSHTMVAMENKCQELTAEMTKESMTRRSLEEDLKTSREEAKKFKKLYCTSRDSPTAPNCHPCPFCPKMFMTMEYLQMHLRRRHLNPPTPTPVQEEVHVSSGIAAAQSNALQKLEEEIQSLRKSLELKEKQLQDEQDRRGEVLLKEMELWKVEQLQVHKKEMEAIRETFIMEVKELCHRATKAEQCIDSLQKQLQTSSSTPVTPQTSPKEDSIRVLREQKKEFCKLKKHLTELVESVVCQQMKEQEQQLQKKINLILKEQNEELEKLNSLMQEKMVKNEDSQNNDLLLTLCEKTSIQEKLLRQQQRNLQKLYCEQKKHQQMQAQQHQKHHYEQQLKELQLQQQQQLQLLQKSLSPKKKEMKSRAKSRPLQWSDITSDKTSCDTKMRHSHLTEALKKNPSLVKDLKAELSGMLQEKLEMHGIQHVDNSISKEDFNEKMSDLEREREALSQKYPDFMELREYYQEEVNHLATEYKSGTRFSTGSSRLPSSVITGKSDFYQDSSETYPDIAYSDVDQGKLQRRHSVPYRAESVVSSTPRAKSSTKFSPLQGTKLSLQKMLVRVKNKFNSKKHSKKSLTTVSSPELSTAAQRPTTSLTPVPKFSSRLMQKEQEENDILEDDDDDDDDDDDEDDDDEEEEDDDGDNIDEYDYEYYVEDENQEDNATAIRKESKSPSVRFSQSSSTGQIKETFKEKAEDMAIHTNWNYTSELEARSIPGLHVNKSKDNVSEKNQVEMHGGGSNVAEISQSIQKQLSVPRMKPFGGLPIIPENQNSSNGIQMNDKKSKDSVEDLSLSSFSDDLVILRPESATKGTVLRNPSVSPKTSAERQTDNVLRYSSVSSKTSSERQTDNRLRYPSVSPKTSAERQTDLLRYPSVSSKASSEKQTDNALRFTSASPKISTERQTDNVLRYSSVSSKTSSERQTDNVLRNPSVSPKTSFERQTDNSQLSVANDSRAKRFLNVSATSWDSDDDDLSEIT